MADLTTMAAARLKADYLPPRHNVLLLSCMDLRLLNELTAFMDRDNLTNRYDHLVTAGAGLGVVAGKTMKKYRAWRKTFFSHLRVSIELHKPEDIYIVEHRNCGAYAKILKKTFSNSADDQNAERDLHREYAKQLAEQIGIWSEDEPPVDGKPLKLRISSFLMDLRGDVEHLDTFGDDAEVPKKKR